MIVDWMNNNKWKMLSYILESFVYDVDTTVLIRINFLGLTTRSLKFALFTALLLSLPLKLTELRVAMQG